MQQEKLITMNESRKYETISRVLKRELSQKTASQILGLTTRQIRNLKKSVKKYGIDGVIHKNKGKVSNNHPIPLEIKNTIINLAKTKYIGYGATLLSEKLKENENICYSKESIRNIMLLGNVYQDKKVKEKHRSQRERRACKGELIQVDGSLHDWFSTGEKCWLLNFIDDATGDIFLMYAPAESTIELMKATKEYILENGVPMAFYVDKDSIYKTSRLQNIEEQLKGSYPVTQFVRAMTILGIEVICANSPQAKGRVERSFRTLQDRLVKENKLLGITSIEEGNEHLKTFTKKFNKQFSVKPLNEANVHRKRPSKRELDKILSIHNKRSIANDYTVKFQGRTYQILKEQKVNILKRNGVVVETRLDGSIRLKYKDTYLKYIDITDNIRLKQHYYSEEQNKTEEVKVMSRKEISNVKTLSPWHKTNSLFFKKRKF